ncbi:hypothetical protein JHK82_050319 [Glycine max]|uniref:TPX2 C-terminal domain-containing protein n=1 Tax=Glycine max TaxID=3847 RepID=A0A0R0FAM9_SOYBN|nr:hypothetical protein JHK82_050319 [Glycine max]KAG5094634.1 hypothetical protein JHK84_050222 [Glycine max]
MGEFLVDTKVFEDKKERWSSFSPNKYLEEVEKCATPRSVAQKKAYFGAHSKKVVARKAELLAQEKQREKDSFGLEEHSGIDLSGSSEGVKHETSSVGEIHRTHVNEYEEEFAVSRDYQSSSVQIDEPENVCKKQVESPNNNIEAEDVKEISHVLYKETRKASEVEVKDVKLNHPKESKVKSVSKGSNAAKTKKKSMLPTSKASPISTPKASPNIIEQRTYSHYSRPMTCQIILNTHKTNNFK